MKYESVKDSGQREDYDTGARRDTQEGKPRYDLITPLGLHRLAIHYMNGAKKYGEYNYTKGIASSRYMASLLRHAFSYLAGDRSEDHLSAISFNALGIAHNEEAIERNILPKEIHDMRSFTPRNCIIDTTEK
jgi:hypothetical protein